MREREFLARYGRPTIHRDFSPRNLFVWLPVVFADRVPVNSWGTVHGVRTVEVNQAAVLLFATALKDPPC